MALFEPKLEPHDRWNLALREVKDSFTRGTRREIEDKLDVLEDMGLRCVTHLLAKGYPLEARAFQQSSQHILDQLAKQFESLDRKPPRAAPHAELEPYLFQRTLDQAHAGLLRQREYFEAYMEKMQAGLRHFALEPSIELADRMCDLEYGEALDCSVSSPLKELLAPEDDGCLDECEEEEEP